MFSYIPLRSSAVDFKSVLLSIFIFCALSLVRHMWTSRSKGLNVPRGRARTSQNVSGCHAMDCSQHVCSDSGVAISVRRLSGVSLLEVTLVRKTTVKKSMRRRTRALTCQVA